MSGLKVLKPMVITPAMLVATDVPDGASGLSDYNPSTTYGAGLAVRVVYDRAIWQSKQAANTGNQPDTSPTWWTRVGAVNRWKLFDQKNSSLTEQSTAMSYSVRPGRVVTALAAVNMRSVTSIRVRVVSDVLGLVYDKTTPRPRTPVDVGWWAWSFGERTESLATQYDDLPSFPDAVITVDFAGLSDMGVGTLMLGSLTEYGEGVQFGAELGLRDFSVKTTNEFGDLELVERPYADTFNFVLEVRKAGVGPLRQFVKSVRATPCLWIGSDEYEDMVMYAYALDSRVVVSYPDLSYLNIELESLS